MKSQIQLSVLIKVEHRPEDLTKAIDLVLGNIQKQLYRDYNNGLLTDYDEDITLTEPPTAVLVAVWSTN